jgi:hypothetical protein
MYPELKISVVYEVSKIGSLPAFDICECEEVIMKVVHLYHSDHQKESRSEQFNKQLTRLECLHADVFLPGREDRRNSGWKIAYKATVRSQYPYSD